MEVWREGKGEVLIEKWSDLSKETTMRVGGVVEYLVFPLNLDGFLKWVNEVNYILGGGSNLIFPDFKLKVTFMSLRKFKSIKDFGDGFVEVSAGVSISEFLKFCIEKGYSGLEVFSGVPRATIGGMIFKNAGAYGIEIKDFVEKVLVYDKKNGELKWILNYKNKAKYRSGDIEGIVLKALLKLKVENSSFVRNLCEKYLNIRRKTQVLDFPSAGSFYKNPENSELKAWELIDKAGLRGFRVGDAAVSQKHCNFIINLGKARYVDILKLDEIVRNRVREFFGIELEREVDIFILKNKFLEGVI